jgi:hypothetical protein
MRERVEAAGGRFDITTSPDGGTTVSAWFGVGEAPHLAPAESAAPLPETDNGS